MENATHYSDCLPCPAGLYCEQGTANPSLECPEGFWCPEGTEKGTQNPCPIGTYSQTRNLTGKSYQYLLLTGKLRWMEVSLAKPTGGKGFFR